MHSTKLNCLFNPTITLYFKKNSGKKGSIENCPSTNADAFTIYIRVGTCTYVLILAILYINKN